MIKIQKAKKEDIEKIDNIYVEGSIREVKLQFQNTSLKEIKKELDFYKKSRKKNFLKEMKLKKHYWIVAKENEEVVGFGQAWIKNKKTGILEKIYVDKNWTRQGIGIKLLRTLKKWLISKRIKYIEAGIYYKNKPSIRLNEKEGYKPISIKMQKEIKK